MKMNLKINKLSKKHSKFLFNLRNESSVRKFSRNKKIIKYENHLKWLKKKSNDKNYKVIIFSNYKGNNIGYVRLKIKKLNVYVSIAISKKYRNKGLSKILLSLAEKKIKNKNFFAEVNKKNLKSISLFNSLNYYKYKDKGNFLIMKKKQKQKYASNYLSIIDKIEKIRKNNNSNWMEILRIAFKYSPKEAAKIMSNIYKQDSKIGSLTKKLSK